MGVGGGVAQLITCLPESNFFFLLHILYAYKGIVKHFFNLKITFFTVLKVAHLLYTPLGTVRFISSFGAFKIIPVWVPMFYK